MLWPWRNLSHRERQSFVLFWGAGQGRDPLACTIQAPNLFLDSLPGHAPPSPRAQGLLGGSHGRSSRHCGTCSSCSAVALGITSALLTMGSETPHSSIYLIRPPLHLISHHPSFPSVPATPAFLALPGPDQLPPAAGALHLLFLHSGKRLLKVLLPGPASPISQVSRVIFSQRCMSPLDLG